MTNQRSSASRAEHCALHPHPVVRRVGSMVMSPNSHMHDNKPNADLGKGSIDGSGQDVHALGERLDTDDNDTYDNYGTNIYGNGKFLSMKIYIFCMMILSKKILSILRKLLFWGKIKK